MDLNQALQRIEELEYQVAELTKELEQYRGKKFAGRQPHDEKWMQGFSDWVGLFENGKSQIEISDELNMSRRTYYRYKKYYNELNHLEKDTNLDSDTKK